MAEFEAPPEIASDDGRQSARALEIARGTCRLLAHYGMRAIFELPLANGRRADLIAAGEDGVGGKKHGFILDNCCRRKLKIQRPIFGPSLFRTRSTSSTTLSAKSS